MKGVKFNEFPRVEHKKQSIPHVIIPTDPALALLQSEMRWLKGALSIWGIYDIETEKPEIEWKPETPEEKDSTDIFGVNMQVTPREEREPEPIPIDIIIRSIISRNRFQEFEIPFEFYRRGTEDLYNERYIEAVYDFYFIFEYLWGNGKYRKNEIISQFSNSSQAVAAFKYALSQRPFEFEARPNDMRRYQEIYKKKNLTEVFKHVVELRGFLHHQSMGRKDNWNPGCQRDFRVDAHIFHWAANKAVLDIFSGVIEDDDELRSYQSIQVFTENEP